VIYGKPTVRIEKDGEYKMNADAKLQVQKVLAVLLISALCLPALNAVNRSYAVSPQISDNSTGTAGSGSTPPPSNSDNFNQVQTGFTVYNVTAPAEFPMSINLNGMFSNGDVTTWNFGDGTVVKVPWSGTIAGQYGTENADYLYTVPGTYNASWTLTDPGSGYLIDSQKWQVNVFPPLATLAVAASINPWTQTDNQPTWMVYLNSTAAGGVPPYTYTWNFGDGTTGTSNQITHTYHVPSSTTAENMGTFLPTVTVTDAKGQTSTINPDGMVAMSTIPNTSNYFSVDPNAYCDLPYNIAYGTMWSGVPGAYAGDPINFTMVMASGSPQGLYGTGITGGVAPYTYAWNLGDGTSSTSEDVTHTYTAPGYYYVTLTATDSQGTTSHWLSTVVIAPAQTTPPPSPTPLSPTPYTTQTPPTLLLPTPFTTQTPQPDSETNSRTNIPNTLPLIVIASAVAIISVLGASISVIRRVRAHNYPPPPPPPPPPPDS
jgi:PKD repeat protein